MHGCRAGVNPPLKLRWWSHFLRKTGVDYSGKRSSSRHNNVTPL